MPENERAREGKWASKIEIGQKRRGRRKRRRRAVTSDRTKYRSTYFRNLTDTIRRRYVPTRRADTGDPTGEIASWKREECFYVSMQLHDVPVPREQVIVNGESRGIEMGPSCMRETKVFQHAADRAFDKWSSYFDRMSRLDTQNASQCAEINRYPDEFEIDLDFVESDLRLSPFNFRI